MPQGTSSSLYLLLKCLDGVKGLLVVHPRGALALTKDLI